jgi:hypothetical protein
MVTFLDTRNFTASSTPADGYDIFIDRQDGVDTILSADINELKNSVINVQKSLKVGDTKAGFWQLNHQASTPSTPSGSGNIRIYAQSDVLKWVDSTGAVNSIAAGVSTLAAIGSSPNANGATITGTTLNLEPASASFGGIVTTGTQTFAGAKTFSGEVTLSSQLRVSDGSASEPSLVFASDDDATGTGLYRVAANSLGFAANGVAVGSYSSTGAWTLGGTSAVSHTLTVGSNKAGKVLDALPSNWSATSDQTSFGTFIGIDPQDGSANNTQGIYSYLATSSNKLGIASRSGLVFNDGSGGNVGGYSSAGAWTFGVPSTNTTHTFNTGTGSPSRNVKLAGNSNYPGIIIDNAAQGAATAMLAANGTAIISFNQSVFAISKIANYNDVIDPNNMGGSGGVNIASATGAGAWTFGASSPGTSIHTMNGSIAFNEQATFSSGAMLWRDTSDRLRLNFNGGLLLANDADSTTFGTCSSTGAWTFGNSTATTSPHFLQANANGDYATVVRNYNTTQPLGLQVTYPSLDPNDSGKQFIVCQGISNVRFQVNSNGGVANYQANNVNLSDMRLKTNISPTSSKLGFICSLQVKDFEYKDAPGKVNTGLIAQEVEALDPSLVQETGSNQIVDGVEFSPKAVRTTEIYHMMIKAIQELKAELDAAKARIEALENP